MRRPSVRYNHSPISFRQGLTANWTRKRCSSSRNDVTSSTSILGRVHGLRPFRVRQYRPNLGSGKQHGQGAVTALFLNSAYQLSVSSGQIVRIVASLSALVYCMLVTIFANPTQIRNHKRPHPSRQLLLCLSPSSCPSRTSSPQALSPVYRKFWLCILWMLSRQDCKIWLSASILASLTSKQANTGQGASSWPGPLHRYD